MARLLIASRSMALALRLSDGHQIVEHPPDHLESLMPEADTDIIVLDVGDPTMAQSTLERLREDGVGTPVLIVSGYHHDWSVLLRSPLAGVHVVPLPITRAALQKGIDALSGKKPSPKTEAETKDAPASAADDDPFVADVAEDSSLATTLEKRLDKEAASSLGRSVYTGGVADLRMSDLVAAMLERSEELYGVSDTAQVLADDVAERASADAAAVLVPDGALWRVAAGVGLRPLERRLALEQSHWLIGEIASTGRAVLIEDTDIVRQQLAGAPLAAWRHLLAIPVPEVRCAVLLARGREAGPFEEHDLTAVVPTVREATALLGQALQVRTLARALMPMLDTDPRAPQRSGG